MNYILWLKAFHIISLVAWFSGLFYLPRLFVYHTEIDISANNNQNYNRFCTMEYKLYNYITTPAAVLTTIFGLLLIYTYGYDFFKISKWLHIKISLIFLLFTYHYYLGILVKTFKNRANKKSDRYYRLINEVPTLFLISIVILAVVKPFI